MVTGSGPAFVVPPRWMLPCLAEIFALFRILRGPRIYISLELATRAESRTSRYLTHKFPLALNSEPETAAIECKGEPSLPRVPLLRIEESEMVIFPFVEEIEEAARLDLFFISKLVEKCRLSSASSAFSDNAALEAERLAPLIFPPDWL